jgi:hypothetical protein
MCVFVLFWVFFGHLDFFLWKSSGQSICQFFFGSLFFFFLECTFLCSLYTLVINSLSDL